MDELNIKQKKKKAFGQVFQSDHRDHVLFYSPDYAGIVTRKPLQRVQVLLHKRSKHKASVCSKTQVTNNRRFGATHLVPV